VPEQRHSLLYSLEPVGVGTPLVESLASYVSRLGFAHMIDPRTLTNDVLAKHLPVHSDWRPASGATLPLAFVPGLNGLERNASAFAEVVARQTKVPLIRHLTCLNLSDAFSAKALLRRQFAWCPACYEEARLSDQVVYDSLAAQLRCVHVCIRHGTPLMGRCPNCESEWPACVIPYRCGYCPVCGSWLGAPSADGRPRPVTPALQAGASVIVPLLAAGPVLRRPRLSTAFVEALRIVCSPSRVGRSEAARRALSLTVVVEAHGEMLRCSADFFSCVASTAGANAFQLLKFRQRSSARLSPDDSRQPEGVTSSKLDSRALLVALEAALEGDYCLAQARPAKGREYGSHPHRKKAMA
jgi:TniQ